MKQKFVVTDKDNVMLLIDSLSFLFSQQHAQEEAHDDDDGGVLDFGIAKPHTGPFVSLTWFKYFVTVFFEILLCSIFSLNTL